MKKNELKKEESTIPMCYCDVDSFINRRLNIKKTPPFDPIGFEEDRVAETLFWTAYFTAKLSMEMPKRMLNYYDLLLMEDMHHGRKLLPFTFNLLTNTGDIYHKENEVVLEFLVCIRVSPYAEALDYIIPGIKGIARQIIINNKPSLEIKAGFSITELKQVYLYLSGIPQRQVQNMLNTFFQDQPFLVNDFFFDYDDVYPEKQKTLSDYLEELDNKPDEVEKFMGFFSDIECNDYWLRLLRDDLGAKNPSMELVKEFRKKVFRGKFSRVIERLGFILKSLNFYDPKDELSEGDEAGADEMKRKNQLLVNLPIDLSNHFKNYFIDRFARELIHERMKEEKRDNGGENANEKIQLFDLEIGISGNIVMFFGRNGLNGQPGIWGGILNLYAEIELDGKNNVRRFKKMIKGDQLVLNHYDLKKWTSLIQSGAMAEISMFQRYNPDWGTDESVYVVRVVDGDIGINSEDGLTKF
ncbi:MAG: hypothetical protein N3F09_01985 [Bacteroidia bacterium]|nr:hypothetical protein [Bacteroidia bacterium]